MAFAKSRLRCFSPPSWRTEGAKDALNFRASSPRVVRDYAKTNLVTRRTCGNKLLSLGACLGLIAASGAWYLFPLHHLPTWNRSAVTATFIGAQVQETNLGNATLLLTYSLQNHTDFDFRLADGPGIFLMSRLKPSGTLSSQQQTHLSYPTFLPARQRARIALELTPLSAWRTENDPPFEGKFKELFTQLTDVQGFVLFDQTNRVEIEFASAWRELKLPPAQRSLTRVLSLKNSRIVIDAGHGGHDTGAIGTKGLMEKDLCLDVALRLGRLIQEDAPSARVIYTRQDDSYITLEQRTEIANKAKADLLLSIHANFSDDAHVRGIETYYFNFNASPEALGVVATENALAQSSLQDLEHLVNRMDRKDKVKESRELARDIQESLATFARDGSRPELNRGVREAPFVVLSETDMPSVLAEISFLSNPAEEQWLIQPSNRQRVAQGLYQGILKYLSDTNSTRHERDRVSG